MNVVSLVHSGASDHTSMKNAAVMAESQSTHQLIYHCSDHMGPPPQPVRVGLQHAQQIAVHVLADLQAAAAEAAAISSQ